MCRQRPTVLVSAPPPPVTAWLSTPPGAMASQLPEKNGYVDVATTVPAVPPTHWQPEGTSVPLEKGGQLAASHLPLLYIGMEYLRTNNLSLARHFVDVRDPRARPRATARATRAHARFLARARRRV